jgi:hypothetical protein
MQGLDAMKESVRQQPPRGYPATLSNWPTKADSNLLPAISFPFLGDQKRGESAKETV